MRHEGRPLKDFWQVFSLVNIHTRETLPFSSIPQYFGDFCDACSSHLVMMRSKHKAERKQIKDVMLELGKNQYPA